MSLGNMTLDQALTLAGLLVPVASALASAVNHVVREKMAAEPPQPVEPWLAALAGGLNTLALNADKAIQMAKLLRRKP